MTKKLKTRVAGWEEPCHPGSGSVAHSIPLSPTMQLKTHPLPHFPAHRWHEAAKTATTTGDQGWEAHAEKVPRACTNACIRAFCRLGLQSASGSVRGLWFTVQEPRARRSGQRSGR
jgi:hypothetical protein